MAGAGEPAVLDAARLAGLLADDDRRRVFAAVTLGAREPSAVAASAGLDAARSGRALARLVDAGLVARRADGHLEVAGEVLEGAARSARPEMSAARGEPLDETGAVLSRFVRGGRLVSIPSGRSKRLVILNHLAQEFEPGRRYSESMVNLILGRWHADTAALRRYLVDEGLLDRAAGEYWRSGGPVPV
jgi:hypothetical protein